MDSKHLRAALCASAAVALLVCVFVYMQNRDRSVSQYPNTENTSQQSGQQEQENSSFVDLKAFLKDDNFFDPTEEGTYSLEEYRANSLTFTYVSVQGDLRVRILDYQKQQVKGQNFIIRVAETNDYRDLDKDGMIYIPQLAPGEYSLRLLPIEGFHVPASQIKVRIKSQVEHAAIEDISYFLVTKEDVEAEKEDTRCYKANEDADRSQVKKLKTATGTTKVGIDVSEANGEIDWDKVAAFGVQFAYVRVGYRGADTGALIADANFAQNMLGASQAGLETGVTFFSQARNEVEAVEEASAVIYWLAEYQPTYPVYFVYDDAGENARRGELGVEDQTEIVKAFLETLRNAGYQVGLYAPRKTLNQGIKLDELTGYEIWLAEYRGIPLYQGYYDMWQYTAAGKINGIEGDVGLNVRIIPNQTTY